MTTQPPPPPLSPAGFREAVARTGFSYRRLAEVTHRDQRVIRRMASGQVTVDRAMEQWLLALVDLLATPPRRPE